MTPGEDKEQREISSYSKATQILLVRETIMGRSNQRKDERLGRKVGHKIKSIGHSN